MPNTLAHLGVQGIATKTIIKKADLKWVYLGCIIPDIPWILQRIAKSAFENIDPYNLRLYCIVQASLFFCLILSAFFASFTQNFRKVFLILGINSFFHLFIDALQTKWGNGVHFLAPISWRIENFGFFWPESGTTYLLAIFGFAFVLINWRKTIERENHFTFRYLTIPLIFIYFVAPLYFLPSSENANNHFVKTLREKTVRQGKYVELDRAKLVIDQSERHVITFSGEKIRTEGIQQNSPSGISIQGTFMANDKISVSSYHIHNKKLRDLMSYIGLILIGLCWSISLLKTHKSKKG